MTAQTKTTLKGYFETGDRPTAAQFINLIDSSLNLAETSAQTVVGSVAVSGSITGYGGGTLNGFTIDSPTLTGTPVAPTASAATNSSQIATTAYVVSALSNVALTGTVVQSVTSSYTSYASFTSVIPNDDTIPQIGEGTQIISQSITPTFASNKLRIRIFGNATASGILAVVTALFRDAGANAIAATLSTVATANYSQILSLETVVNATSTSSTTFTLRVGPNTAGTIYLNGSTGVRYFGGINEWRMTIEEIRG